jgi:hypothetical protein
MWMWTLSKNWWIFYLVLLLPGVIMLIIGIINPNARTDDGMSLWKFGLIWISMMLVIEAGTFIYLGCQKKRASYFEKKGIRAVAAILEAEQTGVEMNGMPQIELRLEIALPGQAPYTINHKDYWSLLALSSLRRGARLPVLVDPRDRKRIMFVDEKTK